MKELSLEEIEFVPSSFCSRDGRLLKWQGSLYRTVTLESSPFYEQLFRDGTIEHMINAGFLVESEIVQLNLKGHGLIIRHRELPFVSYPFEWCDHALKDSALLILDLNLKLLQFGLMTHDAHPWNVLFEGSKPIFVDLDSIDPAEAVNFANWIEEFLRSCLRPLRLFSTGQSRIARLCLQDWRGWKGGVFHQDFTRLTEQDLTRRWLSKQSMHARKAVPKSLRRLLRPARHLLSKLLNSPEAVQPCYDGIQSRGNVLEHLKAEVESVKLPEELEWDYYRDLFTFPSFADCPDWSPKHRNVASVLRMTNPSSVVDIGSNRGWFSQLAAREGIDVIATDVDELLVSNLYLDAKQHNLPIQSIVMDLLWPSPGFGLLDFWAPAVDRLKCEMTMALALTHHLVHGEGLQFDQIVEGLSKFTTRWLLTEFVPYNDPYFSKWEELDWYCLDKFIAALERKFNVIRVLESDPSVRTLIFCERKRG